VPRQGDRDWGATCSISTVCCDGSFQSAERGGVENLAINHHFPLESLHNEFRARRTAGDKGLGHGLILLECSKKSIEARSSRPRGNTSDSSWA